MPCTRPLRMYWTGDYTANGKKEYVFKDPGKAYGYIDVDCGQCMSCRLKKSRETAVRAVHESKSYEKNCFITLTVDDAHMEQVFPGGGLNHRPFQLFMKKLRKNFEGFTEVVHPMTGKKVKPIRALMCGEYGELLMRPHYHACLFNFDFDDKYLFRTVGTVKLYRSPTLEKLWSYGFSTIGEVNFDSACYLARYVTKKITGDMSDDHYFNPITGEIMKKEYIQFPRGYGLGRLFYEQYGEQWFEQDLVRTEKGFKMKPPKYYERIYDLEQPEKLEQIKKKRIRKALENKEDFSMDRMATIERVQKAKQEFYAKRKI